MVGCDGEEQGAVAQLERTPRAGEHTRDGSRCGVVAPRAVDLRRDAFGGAPGQPVVAAARDVDVERALGRRGPQPAARGVDAEDVARGAVHDQRGVAVARMRCVLRDDDLGTPCSPVVGAAAHDQVDQVGQVALRVVAAVGDGQHRPFGSCGQSRNAVVLRSCIARAEEHRVLRGGRFGGPGRRRGRAESEKGEKTRKKRVFHLSCDYFR